MARRDTYVAFITALASYLSVSLRFLLPIVDYSPLRTVNLIPHLMIIRIREVRTSKEATEGFPNLLYPII